MHWILSTPLLSPSQFFFLFFIIIIIIFCCYDSGDILIWKLFNWHRRPCLCVVIENNFPVENLNKILKSYIINFPIHGVALEKSRKVLRVKAKIALSRNNVVACAAVVFILSSSLLFVHSLVYIYILSLMWKIISSHLFYAEWMRENKN